MKRATIVGACGFGGLGLISILRSHPDLSIHQLIDKNNSGRPISAVYPHLRGFCDIIVRNTDETDFGSTDIAFFSTPDRAGMTMIGDFYKRGIPVIDFSGDFRFSTIEDYSRYARNKNMDDEHSAPGMLAHAVYGLPELYRDSIKTAKIVGNPGCFAISMILGLLPAVTAGIIDSGTIICDGKTGVSGAGKNPGEANFYPQRYEDVNTYREGKHQHIVEVENILNSVGPRAYGLFFVPQIVPLARGILTTMYARVKDGISTAKVMELYRDYYRTSPFVIVSESSPHTTDVRGSNRCELRPMVDERTGTLFITSAIDNLMKGQSGNAVQNANIMLGLEETAGLDNPAFYP